MGNREDLLTGAVRCLKERGWSRTTVRDIAAAAGVSHAAIGYHFGSREALLSAAMVQAMDEWGTEMGRVSVAAAGAGADALTRYTAFWTALIASFGTHRELWVASAEAFLLAQHTEGIGALVAAGMREGRSGLAAELTGVPESELDPERVRTVGATQLALISGVMVQHLVDPENAPSATEVVTGLRALAAGLE